MTKSLSIAAAAATITASALLFVPAKTEAQTLSAATCTAPTVVATFTSAVSAVNATTNASSISNSMLGSLKFRKDSSSSDVVALDTYNGAWNAAKTQYTIYPTLQNYRDVNQWDVWPLSITATVSGATSTVVCQ